MSWIIDFLINWGYWGMLAAAFLAGSFFPFSSEAVMAGLQAAGLEPLPLVVYGSIGKAERYMAGRGAWMGFFAFLPLLGSAITIVLGLTRANVPISILSITIGKVLRYVLLVYGLSFIF